MCGEGVNPSDVRWQGTTLWAGAKERRVEPTDQIDAIDQRA